jgi:hypothetical protein
MTYKYEQHNETFLYEMDKLRKSLADPDITYIPMVHIQDMWDQANEIMRQLDQLDAMGTDIPSLTISILRLKAMIFSIPENLNIDKKVEMSKETH